MPPPATLLIAAINRDAGIWNAAGPAVSYCRWGSLAVTPKRFLPPPE
jgi:hypothetical protein